MTGHQVNSLVSDLVLMAKAMEELPGIKAELDHAQGIADHRAETIQRLELKLMDAKNLEDTLRASIRDLEVARDDAELRFLELDEKAGKAMDRLYALADNLEGLRGETIAVINITATPKVEPQPVEVPQANVDPTPVGELTPSTSEPLSAYTSLNSADPSHALGSESASPPISAPSAPIGTGTENVASSYEAASAYPDVPTPLPHSSWASPSGQSEPDPTTAPTPFSADGPTESATASTAESGLTEPKPVKP